MSSATKRKRTVRSRSDAIDKHPPVRATTPSATTRQSTSKSAAIALSHPPVVKPRSSLARRWIRLPLATPIKVGLAAVAVVAVLAGIYNNSQHNGDGSGQNGQYVYAVGQPGLGQVAPAIKLASTSGGTFDLAAYHGKTVMLYFQEGLTCEPCWTQLKDLEGHMDQVKALGVDVVISITTDPIDALVQKAKDEEIASPILSDGNLAVSNAYSANQYGMMGTSRDGHSFVIVGPDGTIRWRADFGGAPNYTMYVPIATLLADMQKGMHGSSN